MQALITTSRTERFMKEKTEPNKIEEVAQTLEQEIEELEKQLAELNEMKEGARLNEIEKSQAWAKRVDTARKLQRKKLEGRAKAKKMSHLNPARLRKLRALGKL